MVFNRPEHASRLAGSWWRLGTGSWVQAVSVGGGERHSPQVVNGV